MRPFAVVNPSLFWAEHIGRQLRALGRDYQALAFYLWTAPTSNPYGLYYLPMTQLCEEAGYSTALAAKVLDAFGSLEFAFYHRAEQWVWVKAMAQTSLMPTGKLLPRTDNRIRGLHSWYAAVPDNPYLAPFFRHYARAFYMEHGRAWSQTHVEVTIEPARQLEAGTDPGEPSTALSAPAGTGSLFPEIAPRTLVPVARRAIAKRPVGTDPLFDQWFGAYPAHRRIEKREAFQEWIKIRPAPDAAWMVTALATLARQSASVEWNKDGGKYVPKPANYLKKGKYDDEVVERTFIPEADVDRMVASYNWGRRQDHDDDRD